MNKLSILALASALTLIAGPSFAADAAAGKAKAEEACVDCHGDDGKGDDRVPERYADQGRQDGEGGEEDDGGRRC
jgi:cytochrome c553